MPNRDSLRTWLQTGLLVLLGLSTWIPILIINVFYWTNKIALGYGLFPASLGNTARMAFFAIFFAANYFAVDQILRKRENWEVFDLLWKLFVMGTVSFLIVILLSVIQESLYTDALYSQFLALSASVRLYALLVFCLSAIFIYKKLILYQKNKRKVLSWNILQIAFLLGIVRLFLGQDETFAMGMPTFASPQSGQVQSVFSWVVMPMFLLLSLLLSLNVNWSAYLNKSQKWKSLGLILGIGLYFVLMFRFFPVQAFPDESNPVETMTQRYMLLGLLFIFPAMYTLVSALVILFNLPTSSVFEQRSSELATIQRINQSIQSNLDSEEILRTLIDAALLTSNATGGWIETFTDGDTKRSNISYLKHVSLDEIDRLRARENISEMVVASGKHVHIKNLRKQKAFRYVRTRIKSLLALPIKTSKHPVGVVYLINELPGSFEEIDVRSMVSLTEQSGISIENAELVAKSIDLEIYREQLRLAQEFQRRILPQTLPGTDKIEFFVAAQEVDEIGGDFYDVTQKGNMYKLAIGDVSGKGTTAAFYMAETKGIFQALTNLDLSVRDFVLTANKALSNCLAKGSFMTLTYMHIDMEAGTFELLRAGHCPTLFYDASEDKLHTLDKGGPGLGIIRNDNYASLLGETETHAFSKGDMILLFTDGIVEARNANQEEFNYHRLQDIVYRLRHADSRLIVETLVQQVMAFNGGKIEDDYSILALKFL